MKRENKLKLINAINNELLNCYHNASLSFPKDDMPAYMPFFEWVQNQAEFEVDYLNDGGACGLTPYNEMQHIKEKAEKFKTNMGKNYFLRMKRRQYIAESSAYITDYIVREYGKIYSYGRGGATLVPESWCAKSWRGFNALQYDIDDCEGVNAAYLTKLLHDVTAWNKYVSAWCKNAPQHYYESARNDLNSNVAEFKSQIHEINRKALALIKEIKAHGVFSAAICETLTEKLNALISDRKAAYNEIKALNESLALCY